MTRVERFPGHQFPQVVPEPDEVRPGGPVPWGSSGAVGRVSLATVRERLREAGRTLSVAAPPLVPGELEGAGRAIPRRSAVLVALYDDDDGAARMVLTRRSSEMRHHRGEVALPGGRSEEGEDDVATALREAEEEVGLDPALVEPLARLSPLASFVSGSAIWPVVGALAAAPVLAARTREVERVFTVALADLLAPGASVVEHWRRDPVRPGADEEGFFPMFFYRVPGELVWGATARVITELLCLVTGVPWPPELGVGRRRAG